MVVCSVEVYESAFNRLEHTLVIWLIDYGHIGSVCKCVGGCVISKQILFTVEDDVQAKTLG